MSRMVMERILNEMLLRLTDSERKELYGDLLYYFGIIGGVDECEALEAAWEDPYVKPRIKEFIREWIRRRRSVAVYVS